MDISQKNLVEAVNAKLISTEQAEQLWVFWQSDQQEIPRFKFTHILYYLGGMIAISAITLYVTNAWDRLKGWPLLTLAFFLLMFGLSLTHYFLSKKLRIPAGIMAVFSLAIIPLIVYNIQFLLGIAPSKSFLVYADFNYIVDWYWVNMELATLLVGVVMFYFYRFSFLLFPIAIILWYMSMDLCPLLLSNPVVNFQIRAQFSMCFGLLILLAALYMDLKYDDEKEDYAFWLYIAGVLAFWGGLSALDSDSEFAKFGYFIVNLIMLFISAILNRRVFAVFGVIGMLGYLGHLAFTVFANSLSFPVILIFIGVLIMFAAAFFTRIEGKLKRIMRPYIPNKILKKMQASQ